MGNNKREMEVWCGVDRMALLLFTGPNPLMTVVLYTGTHKCKEEEMCNEQG